MFEWFRKKFRKPEAKLLEEPSEEEYRREYSEAKSEAERLAEELKEEQEERRKAEEELRKKKKKPEYGKREQEFAWGWWEYARATIPDFEKLSPDEQRKKMEELASRIPREQAERISKSYREAAKASAESGIPYTRTEYVKTWVPGHYIDPATGRPVKEGTPGAEYKPGEYTFRQIPLKRSPAEIMAEAAILRTGIEEMEERRATLRQARRGRRLAPVRAIGRGAKEVAAVTALGIAGVAQSIQPGRGGPARAERMLTPRGVPLELYGIRRQTIDLSGLRGGVQPRVGPSLGHLRGAVLPSSLRRPTQIRRPAMPTGTPATPSLEKLKKRIRSSYPKLRIF